eukprot:TRINITY_DN3676_c1_g2_i1.p1 TRINITY_DN3676_c1_g2~~TRINITY_DN3676_c1_g2_i1.p1  ORF type:complete len:758 (-),score=289.86 TRINITY_DN3676_c1_g2_i1:62-2314(-)
MVNANKRTRKFKAKNKPDARKKKRVKKNPRQAGEETIDKDAEENEDQTDALNDMDVDSFLESGFLEHMDDDDSDSDSEGDEEGSDGEGEESGVVEEEDDDDDDDDDEDDEDDEDGDDLEKEVASHKAELKRLREQDPEFAKFLEENDKGLLDFADEDDEDDDEDDELDEDDDDDEDASEKKITKKKKKKSVHIITKAKAELWINNVEDNTTIHSLKRIVYAFRAACHFADDNVDDDEDNDEDGGGPDRVKLAGPDVFNDLMLFSLRELDGLILEYLGVTATPDALSQQSRSIVASNRWKRIAPIIKSYTTNLLHFMGHVSDTKMTSFVLKQVGRVIPFFSPFQRKAKKLLKILLRIWSKASSEASRILAFVCIRNLALAMPFPFIELTLKGLYLTYVRNAKFLTPSTRPLIHFMQNCVVELYGLDFKSSYQHIFVYVRQLAMHLRSALMVKSKDSFKNVYNWQFLNSLAVWIKVLAAYPGEEDLSHLMYPVVQVTVGVIGLVSSPRYFALHLHCVQMLNALSRSTFVFINTACYLQAILDAPELRRKGKPGTKRPLDLTTSLKASESQVQTKAYHDVIVKRTMQLYAESFANMSGSVSFPEAVLPSTIHLRAVKKQMQVHEQRQLITQLLDLTQRTINFVKQKRANLNGGPGATSNIGTLWSNSPLQQHVAKALTAEKNKEQPPATVEEENEDEEKWTKKSGAKAKKGADPVKPKGKRARVEEVEDDEDGSDDGFDEYGLEAASDDDDEE